jgi:hypothetical protein
VNGYVEAGYAVALGTLALYAGRLVVRRRALERAGTPGAAPGRGRADRARSPEAQGGGAP